MNAQEQWPIDAKGARTQFTHPTPAKLIAYTSQLGEVAYA